MTREWPRLAAGALLLAGLAVFTALRLRVTTDIAAFLPGGAPNSTVELAQRIATGDLSRTMVLLVTAKDRDEAAAVSRAFAAALADEPGVAAAVERIDAGPPAGLEQALWEVYEPRRFAFVAPTAAAATARLQPAALQATVRDLRDRLASPMSSLISRVAPRDPFLVLPHLFETFAGNGAGDGLGVVDDRFVTADGDGAVLFVTTRTSASDSTTQRPLLAGIAAAFARVRQQFGDHLTLQQSGANRHAIGAEDAMRTDIQRVTIGSVVGVLLTFLLVFRSLRPPLTCLPILATGFVAGASACLLAFGAVHGLTLAFGSSLIGVSIDYALHFHSHQALAGDPRGPRATLRGIWPSLLLGAATTVVGFVALLVATFPGLRELALFAAVGISAALLASWLWLPGLAGAMRPTGLARRLVAALRNAPASARPRRAPWAALALVALVLAIGLPRTRWDDGIRNLNRIDPVLKAEDDAVHARVARFEQRRVVVAVGDDEEQALVANERVAAALADATAAGELDGYRNVAGLLPSAARQRAVDAAVRTDATLWPRLRDELAAAEFVVDAFQPFADGLAAPPPPPLVAADLLATPLAALVRPFRLVGPDGPAMLSFVADAADEAALQRRLAAIDGVHLLDVERVLTEALAGYRTRMQELLLVGLLAVIALVWLQHRRLRPTLLACGPALLAAATTIAILALCGVPLDLLSLVALLMVVSMGVDYGIFLAADEAPGHATDAHDATHLAIVLASLTTVFGFGLLALSAQPALFRIGLTSGVGILVCLVFALLGSAWSRRYRGPAEP